MTETPNPHIIDADTLTGQMRPLRRVVLALGSNLGDRAATLQGALNAIADTPDVQVVAVSPVYETKPVGGPADSPDFLNAVVLAESMLSPRMLLERALAIEDAFGRVRTTRWAPRTLDVDLLVVGDTMVDDGELELPHPRAHERAFVLVPWADIEPDGDIPGVGRVRELVARVDTSTVRRARDVTLHLG